MPLVLMLATGVAGRGVLMETPLVLMLATGIAGRSVLQLSKPMSLSATSILRESQNTDPTLSPPTEIRAIVRHMGDPGTLELQREIATSITWNVSRLTGVAPPVGWQSGSGQRGCYDREGANAFQAAGSVFASWINTSSWNHTVGVRGGGPQAQVYTQWDAATTTRPWAIKDAAGGLTTSYTRRMAVECSAKLPVITGQLAAPGVVGAVGQMGLQFYAKDTVSGKLFSSGGAIWDSRPFGNDNGNEFVASDTFTPFASSCMLPGNVTKYISVANGSAYYSNTKAWSEWRWFKYTVSARQLELAAHAINDRFPGTNISTRAADYEVTSMGWGNEVTGYFDHPLAYGMAVANLSAYVEED